MLRGFPGTNNIINLFKGRELSSYIYGEKYSKEYASTFFDLKGTLIQERKVEFMNYLNKYICVFDEPHIYGWRNYDKQPNYSFRTFTKLGERMNLKVLNEWNKSDLQKNYIRMDFIVNEEDDKDKRVYNTYVRPCHIKYSDNLDDIYCICPTFFDFLKRIITDCDEKCYEWILDYLSVIVKLGRTKVCIVLMGEKGTGKSTWNVLLQELVGQEYCCIINNINRLTKDFNKLLENKIVVSLEEVVNDAAEYVKVQETLKTLITEERLTIEPKGVDSYTINSVNNFNINTNNFNPVKITDDNRRYMVLSVSSAVKNDSKYFEKLRQEVKDNIEQLRYFFYHRNCCRDLQKTRPTSNKELELLDLNKNTADKFITEELILTGDPTDPSREYQTVYSQYENYCAVVKEKPTKTKYFSIHLKKYGLLSQRIQQGGNRNTYIQGRSISQFIA